MPETVAQTGERLESEAKMVWNPVTALLVLTAQVRSPSIECGRAGDAGQMATR